MQIQFGAVQLERLISNPRDHHLPREGSYIELVFTDQDKQTYKPLLDSWGREPEKINPLIGVTFCPQDALKLSIQLFKNDPDGDFVPLFDSPTRDNLMSPDQTQLTLLEGLLNKLPILDKVKQDFIDALKRTQKP